jgi:sialic acid synthase SpsE
MTEPDESLTQPQAEGSGKLDTAPGVVAVSREELPALPDEAMFGLFDYCRELGLTPLCTPWDIASVESLERYGAMPGYKVASADLTHHDLLHALARTGKPR